MTEETAEQPAEEPAPEFGLRQLLRAVNLRDFAQMAGNELYQIGSTFARRLSGAARLPLGPFLLFATSFVLVIRLFLLTLVIFFFGSGILALTVLRSVSRIMRTRPDDVETS